MRNQCTSSIRTSKSTYYLTLTNDSFNNPSKFWKTIKVLQNKKASVFPQELKTGNVSITDKHDILNAFNSHFEKAGHIFDQQSSVFPPVSSECTIPASTPSTSVLSFEFDTFQVSDVLHALNTIDPKKSSGPDGLDPFLLKAAAPIIAEPITHIFNMSIGLNQVPVTWKQAYVTPLLKAGNQSDLNNYRPISNLSVLSKILESLVASQLKSYLDSLNILNNMQSGFRSRHSTVSATLKVFDDIKEALDNKLMCVSLFIDLTKAFDTVDHPLLINTLLRAGIGCNALKWFHSYLNNRSQIVKDGNIMSDPVTVTKGVPQGSVLGPFLFLVYINNICDKFKHCKYHLYADDTVMYACAPSAETAFSNLQSDFNTLQLALSDLKLVLNSGKTKTMIFSSARKKAPTLSINTLDGVAIQTVDTYKYLGIWLDKSLNFHFHIDHLAKKLKFTLGFLYRLKSCFSMASRKRLVAALFLSQLDFGDNIYRFASASILSKLDPLYHSALRYVTNSGFRTHHCTLYSLVGWSSLTLRRLQHWYILVYKIILGKLPFYLNQKFMPLESSHNLRSHRWFQYKVPPIRTQAGKASLFYYGPWSWNDLQAKLKLETLISLNDFKLRVKEVLTAGCICFN